MDLTKLIVVCLALKASNGLMFKTASNSQNSATLVEATVNILSTCYEKEVNTVGLAEISEGVFFDALRSKLDLPVTLVGNVAKDASKDLVNVKAQHKLRIFVVAASSSKQLQQNLRHIKSTLWWNHMATFLIIDWESSSNRGCINAFEFLWTAWKIDILNGLYLCRERTKELLIYSYNPYTNQAPRPWKFKNTYRKKNDHPWTLFVQEYKKGGEMCENLEFDKTSDLGGYKIYATAQENQPFLHLELNKTGMDSFSGPFGLYARILFRALNATSALIIHESKTGSSSVDASGKDLAMDTVDGVSDILLIIRSHSAVQNFTVSHSVYETGLSVLTKKIGYMSQLSKILRVVDRSTRFGLCVVAVITAIFFKCFLQQPLASAVLNVFRIICNSSLTKVPKSQAARIYLTSVFFLAVTIIGIYQGIWASLLTKSQPLPNVETMQDLAGSSYTIHTHQGFANCFTDEAFEGRIIGNPSFDCSQRVLQSSSTACVMTDMRVISAAAQYELHRSDNLVEGINSVYVVRKDWPLQARFNKIITALKEADIHRRVVFNESDDILRVSKYYAELEKVTKFQVMKLNELGFAFAILGIGSLCATLCFIGEIIISRAPVQQ